MAAPHVEGEVGCAGKLNVENLYKLVVFTVEQASDSQGNGNARWR